MIVFEKLLSADLVSGKATEMSFLEVDVDTPYLLANEVIADCVNCEPSARGISFKLSSQRAVNKYLEVTWKIRVDVASKGAIIYRRNN